MQKNIYLNANDLPRYTEIRKEKGQKYLFDRSKYEMKKAKLSGLLDILELVPALLRKYTYPTAEEWQKAVIIGGEAGISEQVAAQVEESIKRLKMPDFMAAQIRKGAIADLPQEMLTEARELRNKWEIATNGLPISSEDLAFTGDRLTFDKEAIAQRIKEGYSLPISPEREKEAESLKAFIVAARTLNESGVDIPGAIRSLLGNHLNPATYPDLDNEYNIFNTLNTNRHQTAEQLRLSNPSAYYAAGGAREKEA